MSAAVDTAEVVASTPEALWRLGWLHGATCTGGGRASPSEAYRMGLAEGRRKHEELAECNGPEVVRGWQHALLGRACAVGDAYALTAYHAGVLHGRDGVPFAPPGLPG